MRPISGLHALPAVGAGVKVIVDAGNLLQLGEVVRHGLQGEFPHPGVLGAGIDGVRRVGDHRPQGAVGQLPRQYRRVLGVEGLGPTAPGIAGEELEGVRPDGGGCAAHGAVAAGR